MTQQKDARDENFPVASFLLSAHTRPHVMAFYDFARRADDVADDGDMTCEEKLTILGAMFAQLADGRNTPYPQVKALHDSLVQTGVSAQHAQDLLKAFEWDASHSRTADWEALMAYCALSAAPVGRYLIELTGGMDGAYAPSDALCAALQVLNHLQDIKDDKRALDRIYIPQNWMAEAGVEEGDLSATQCTPALALVKTRMLDGVDGLLDQAKPLPKLIKSRALAREAAGIRAIACALSRKLRRQDPLAGRVELSKADMALRFAWGALRA